MVNDGALNVLDGDRELIDAKNTGTLTWCRTHSSSEFCGYIDGELLGITIFMFLDFVFIAIL